MLRASVFLLLANVIYSTPPPGGGGDDSGSDPGTGTGTGGQNETYYFPADNNPSDYIISEQEFMAYKDAWQQGTIWNSSLGKIPLDSASLAGTIFYGYDGVYHVILDDANEPTVVPGSEIGEIGEIGTGGSTTDVGVTVIGTVPATVYLTINPPEGTFSYAVEERIPDGWIFKDCTTGTYSSEERILRIGPLPANIETHEYTLLSMLGGALKPTRFSSLISYDGTSEPLTSHYAIEQYGVPLSIYLDNETPTDEELWAYAIHGSSSPAENISDKPVFSFFKSEDGKQQVKAQIQRYVLADDVEIQIQYSDNMQDWYPLNAFDISVVDETEPDIHRFEVIILCPEQSRSLFYRSAVLYNQTTY